jgi:predicted nucleic-acid-binding Zn-ribbon protein
MKLLTLNKENIDFYKSGDIFVIAASEKVTIALTKEAVDKILDGYTSILEEEAIKKVCYSCRYFEHYKAESGFCSVEEIKPGKCPTLIDMWDHKCDKHEIPPL